MQNLALVARITAWNDALIWRKLYGNFVSYGWNDWHGGNFIFDCRLRYRTLNSWWPAHVDFLGVAEPTVIMYSYLYYFADLGPHLFLAWSGW